MKILENKVAIVTGAGSGIGREIAISYATEGAKVVVSDLNEKGGNETVSLITKNGGEAIFNASDSSLAESNRALVDATVKRFGVLCISPAIMPALAVYWRLPQITRWMCGVKLLPPIYPAYFMECITRFRPYWLPVVVPL